MSLLRARCAAFALAATWLVLAAVVPRDAHAQAAWSYLDLGPIGGAFVGPPSARGNAISVGQAFTSRGGFDTFNYGGAGIYDLGSYGGSPSDTFYVNALGQVAGQTPGTANRAFYFAGGSATAIAGLGGSGTYVTGMNASGQVIGFADTPGNVSSRAFVYSPGALVDLGTLGGSSSIATGINAAGAVVGNAYTANDAASHAFLSTGRGAALRDLGTLGGSNSTASAVNAAGQVIGDSYLSGNQSRHAFLYGGGTLRDLGTLGGSFSTGIGINAGGQVVGNSYIAGDAATRAFLYAGTTLSSLGTLGGTNSFALGVNSLGQVIGLSDVTGNGARHSFLWSAGQMIDLDGSIAGISGFVATGINDAMQIIGYGVTASGSRRGFVISAVPAAPAGLELLAGLGVAAACWRRRYRRVA